MPEVTAMGEDHRRTGLIDRCDHLGVPLRAAGLDEGRDAGAERQLRAVGEGKERIRGQHGVLERVSVLARLLEGDPHRVDAAHLAGADP